MLFINENEKRRISFLDVQIIRKERKLATSIDLKPSFSGGVHTF